MLRRLVAGHVSLAIEYDLRNLLYAHLQKLELGFFAGQQTGQLMSRATVDLSAVRFFLGYGLVFILQSALTILLAAVAMFLLQPGAGRAGADPGAVRGGRRGALRAPLAAGAAGGPAADRRGDRGRRGEHLRRARREGVRGRAAPARALPRQRSRACSTQSMFATRLRAFYNPFLAFLPNLGLAVILLVGGRQVINGTLTLGDFTAFYTYLLMLIGPMRMLGVALGLAQRATASGARLFEILDREPRIVGGDAPPLPAGPRARRAARRDVRLRRRARRRCATSILDGRGRARRSRWSARPARARRRWCSCCRGCTTRSAGAVLIDGADVRDVDLVSLRRAIAVVDDDPFLFSDTVAGNIAYARPDASREEIERAAERAQAAGFIAELPDGYDTRVGERGLTLSGGQRQRIAIARALLADPRILVLDDATSSVDATTEREIKAALREVMAGRTTFVIAHRLSTIALADDIVVLEDGRDRRARHARRAARRSPTLYAEIATKGLPDQVFLQPRPASRRVAGAVSGLGERATRRDELVRRWRATSGRGRKLRGLVALLRPYRGARRR